LVGGFLFLPLAASVRLAEDADMRFNCGAAE
jgi:hypothetical protein